MGVVEVRAVARVGPVQDRALVHDAGVVELGFEVDRLGFGHGRQESWAWLSRLAYCSATSATRLAHWPLTAVPPAASSCSNVTGRCSSTIPRRGPLRAMERGRRRVMPSNTR